MIKCLLLFMIIMIKVLVGKGIALLCVLVSFTIKGNCIHKSELKWNKYILSLEHPFVYTYAVVIYTISTVLSACTMFLLCRYFKFQYPVCLTLVTSIIGICFSWHKYHNRKSLEVVLDEVKGQIKSNSTKEDE